MRKRTHMHDIHLQWAHVVHFAKETFQSVKSTNATKERKKNALNVTEHEEDDDDEGEEEM